MTDLDLISIQRRADAATPGPWIPKHVKTIYTNGEAEHEVRSKADVPDWLIAVRRFRPAGDGADDPADRDVEFIAAARTDVVNLVAALREAKHLLREVAEVVDACPTCDAWVYGKRENHRASCRLAAAIR